MTLDTLWKDFKSLAHYWNSLMDGDTIRIEDAQKLLQEYSLMDADGFWLADELEGEESYD